MPSSSRAWAPNASRHQLLRDLFREGRIKPASDVDGHQFRVLAFVVCLEFRALKLKLGLFGVSLRVDRHVLPAVIDIAPATRPATPATNTLLWVACAAATPSTKLDVDRIPSLAPSTAARSQAMRPVRCSSLLLTDILELICGLRSCYLTSLDRMTNRTGSVLVVDHGVPALLPTGAQDEPR